MEKLIKQELSREARLWLMIGWIRYSKCIDGEALHKFETETFNILRKKSLTPKIFEEEVDAYFAELIPKRDCLFKTTERTRK